MNNEIKEIIDTLQECINNPVITDFYYKNEVDRKVHITSSGCKVLLDYITNLQHQIEHLDKVNCHLRKKINNDIYKSRIEKAVEYIINAEDMCYYGKCNDGDLLIEVEEDFKKDLLNILNGKE